MDQGSLTDISDLDLDRLNLHIDLQMSEVWGALPASGIADELVQTFGEAARVAYTLGYHDGDYADPFKETWPDELGIDLRLCDVWSNLDALVEDLDEGDIHVLANVLRASYSRGYLDGSGEKPFGPAPQNSPTGLRLPV